ncbi:MAG: response regulator transcription factor [Lachnospiraceae bacterium]|nr:response regulator transcription factor [Lachnospiraceae bacterium]
MRIAVCDDEKEMQKILVGKIKELYPETEVFGYGSGEELLQAEEAFDIFLLDIQMAGRNGMETAAELRKKNRDTILIFITALEEYVFQAFDVGAFHYLVKPFTDEKFEAVLAAAVEQCGNRSSMEREKEAAPEERYIVIKTGGVRTRILIKDIVYAEVFNRKVLIHSIHGDIEYYGKLSDLEKQLGEDFFRAHRANLVHFKYVEKYNVSEIWLEKGHALMAKQNYAEFVKRYLRYNQRKGSRSL